MDIATFGHHPISSWNSTFVRSILEITGGTHDLEVGGGDTCSTGYVVPLGITGMGQVGMLDGLYLDGVAAGD